MVEVRWPRWPPHPYMVETFKNLLLQNRECLGAEPLQESSGTRGLPKLLRIVVCWHLTFLRQGQVCFPMHLYGKNLQKSSSPKPSLPYGWIFAYIIGNGRATKIAKLMVVHWHLITFRPSSVRPCVCRCIHPLTFSNGFSSEAAEPILLKFHMKPP